MTDEIASARRLDLLLWSIVAAVALTVAIGAPLRGFHFDWASFSAPAATAAIGAAAAWFYRTRRPDPRLASALEGTAQLLVFAAVGAPLSYLGASLAMPLQDRVFDMADRAMDFDWSALLTWMNDHPALHPTFRIVYLSLMPQTLVIVLALAWSGRLLWLRVFMLAFFIATVATIIVAAAWPAEGVWGFHRLAPADYAHIYPATNSIHLPIFHGLRDGSFRTLMATGAEGITTFPSLHAALAVLLAAGLWPIPVLRWIGLILNIAMLVSIPVDGGHYFIDMVVGIAIALVALVIARDLAAAKRPVLVAAE